MKVKKVYTLLTCFILLFIAGCGYNMGKISNPQIKSIAIAPIKNECYLPNLSKYMINALTEAFQVDGSYKVKSMYDADCILYGRVTDVNIGSVDRQSTTTGTTFTTREFSVNITFEFTVVIPGQAAPLIPTTTVIGTAEYQVPVDQFIAQQNGIIQASWDAAKRTVWGCAESW